MLTFGALPSAVIAGSPDTSTIILQDNDTALTQVEVSFNTASYTAVEGGSAATVMVELDANPARMVTIPISVTWNGGASVGDYSGVPASVTFNSGDTAETFTVTALSDIVADNGESLTLGFGPLPSGVAVGNSDTAIVNLAEHGSRLMVVTASYDTATYTIAESGSSATVTVESDVNPARMATARLDETTDRDVKDVD